MKPIINERNVVEQQKYFFVELFYTYVLDAFAEGAVNAH